ncbi:MAG: methylenetetrahydrofolate reductase [Burkholderiales bacterium]|nr:methylenetetrahydrofolate reductase [Burkholderiales bacterium]
MNAAEMSRSNGRLEAALRAGHFVMTAETSPLDAATSAPVLARAGCLKGLADAVNVCDGPSARSHMSAFATAVILAQNGIEPVLQLTVRDRNRIALQADLLGAAALGVPNILCLHGDDIAKGDQPEAKPVHDIDSRELMQTARRMRDEGVLPSGRALESRPRLLIGAADTPIEPKPGWRPDGLRAKIAAGAEFVQTQFCFDPGLLRRYLSALAAEGILEQVFVIVGIGPLPSAKSARWMNANLYGVNVPEPMIRRLEQAPHPETEGRRICVELLQELAGIKGVAGAHMMGPKQEQSIAEVIVESGLLARRDLVCAGRT